MSRFGETIQEIATWCFDSTVECDGFVGCCGDDFPCLDLVLDSQRLVATVKNDAHVCLITRTMCTLSQ